MQCSSLKNQHNDFPMKKIKVLHIVAGDLNGGAARGAKWLHHGLIDINVESKILTNSSTGLDDWRVTTICVNRRERLKISIRFQVEILPLKFYPNKKDQFFSPSISGYNFINHPLYQWADIIHLHWINGGFVNIKHLAKIDKPIVWTLRDMWPMTGGCHYTMGCEKFITGCGNCVQLGSQKDKDLSYYVLKRKMKYYPSNMKLVGISHWISEKARESKVFQGFDIQTIYNNVNCNDFYPINKQIARKIMGIETNKKIILVGAINIKDFYKGFAKYTEAIEGLDKDKYFLAFFGKLDNKLVQSFGFEYKHFGYLHDTVSLRLLYSAADVFVAPTLMDAFGKTLSESMACGTPVVCFDSSGPKDIVDHQVNGYKAKPFDADDLRDGIKWVLNAPNYTELVNDARKKATDVFDNKVTAMQYQKLYTEMLATKEAQQI